jgi:integrase/recombinase XerD
MAGVKPDLKVVGGSSAAAKSPLEAVYEHFRLDRMGNRVSPNTLSHYDHMVRPFLAWAAEEGVRRFEDLKVERLRHYRALVAARPLQGRSVLDSHKALMTFFRWAAEEEYDVDRRILSLKRPKVPEKEATVFHVNDLRAILAACDKRRPSEELAVRILVGAGVRASELCGLAVRGPDGLSDVMTDSLTRGRVELRVRWDAGAKGQKSRRVPITPKMAATIKRYEARYRPEVEHTNLLINRCSRPYKRYGIDEMMDRIQRVVGFRVHAHAFRHTFATVATKLGWNLEHLRAAMGHADYKVLQHYVRLATERDLGSRRDWLEFIAANPALVDLDR